MFEKASRLKLRFESTKGPLAVEDLWDLPLTSARGASLDQIAVGLHKQLKDTTEESFVNRPPKADEELQLKFDLVKHVIDVRLAENEAAKSARDKKEKKDRLLALIAKKQDEALEQTSLDDLQKMVADL